MDNESLDPKRPFIVRLFAVLGILLILALCAFPAHCKTAPPHNNSLGVDIPYDNPYIYNLGDVVDGAIVEDRTNREATSIRFQPFGTFELYTEQLLFCGNRASAFHGVSGPVVLTYKRVAHEMVGGVACHDLEAVTPVQTKDAQ